VARDSLAEDHGTDGVEETPDAMRSWRVQASRDEGAEGDPGRATARRERFEAG
jgi:hypothetical protein